MRARVVVVAVVGGVLACGCGSAQRADSASAIGHPHLRPVVRPVLAAADPPVVVAAVRPILAARIHVPAGAADVVTGDGALWVAGFGAVTRLDQATGRGEDRIRTPGTGDYSQIAVGYGSVWVTASDRGRVYRIDPSTNRVAATIHAGGPVEGIAAGAARVWVTRPLQRLGDVIRIDPRTNRVAGPPIEVGPGPGQVTYGQGAVWVQNTSPVSVVRVDPATGHVSTVIGTHAVANGSAVAGAIAVGYGSLWTAGDDSDDSLTRIDPRTSEEVASIGIHRAVAVATGAGEVWILASPRSSSPIVFDPVKHTSALWEVDPKSNRIVGQPIRLDAPQPIAIAVTHRNLWVADYNSATVTRIHLHRLVR
jgi:streptogramin lyase